MKSDQIIKRLNNAMAVRRPYEAVFADLTRYFSPYRDDFIGGNPVYQTYTRRPRTDLYNTEGANCAEQLASVIMSGLLNYANKWFQFTVRDPQIMHDIPTRQFLELATDIMTMEINRTGANFYSQAHEVVLDLVIYGTGCLYIEEDPSGSGFIFTAVPFGQIFISENQYRQIDGIFNIMSMTCDQIEDKWPDKVSDALKRESLENPDRIYKVVHHVCEREDAQTYGSTTPKDKLPYASYFVLQEDNTMLEEGGYHEMPYVPSRWVKRAGEVYARAPAWNALPDTKRANAIEKTMIETSERMGNPPILMSDDGVITQLRLVPGQPVIGGLDSLTGGPRLQPMQVGGNLPVTLQMLQKIEQNIRDKFFVGSLAQYNPSVEKTATEIIEFRREEARMMGPQIGKIQSEMLEPIIIRCRNILQRQKKFPPLPQGLAGVSINLEYTSPLAKVQQADDLDAIQRTLQTVIPFMQADPSMMDNFNSDEILQHVAEASGFPPSCLRDPRQVAQIRQQRQESQQQNMNAQNLQALSQANLNFSKSTALQQPPGA